MRVRQTQRVWVPPIEQPNRLPPCDNQRDACVNGTRGVLKRPLESPPSTSSSTSTSTTLGQPSTSQQSPPDFALPGSSTASSSSCDEEDETSDDVVRKMSSKKTAMCTVGSARPSVRPNARHNRQRQLESLDRMEQRLKALRAGGASSAPVRRRPSLPVCPMRLYVLDVSQVAQAGKASWLPLLPQAAATSSSSAVEEVILYSLVLGRGELILFGGIQKDLASKQEDTDGTSEVVSSSLHFITSKRDVI
ncbi:uncharacterized protein LOC142803644 [Rhipicephalus microplus]|uniref:uncharacterized protein LOC142803644 n=1 Tax=Rhipicephalus microplus TaxID=6941 RepID=UPI003F6C1007